MENNKIQENYSNYQDNNITILRNKNNRTTNKKS